MVVNLNAADFQFDLKNEDVTHTQTSKLQMVLRNQAFASNCSKLILLYLLQNGKKSNYLGYFVIVVVSFLMGLT